LNGETKQAHVDIRTGQLLRMPLVVLSSKQSVVSADGPGKGLGAKAEALHAARQRELDEKAAELSSVAAERDALAQRLSEQRLAMLLLEVEGAEAVERLQVT
jgi:hypothetical protein